MKLVILSDIHANLEAFTSVIQDIKNKNLTEYRICILGDVINYGLHPNEILQHIQSMQSSLEVLLAGNHEMALLGFEENRFSSLRGKEALDITKKIITPENVAFIQKEFAKTYIHKIIDNKKYLFIHGALHDIFWGTIHSLNIENVIYKEYDIVFSGHSHIPHFIETFYEENNPLFKNKKKTIFINPGSVGQPRNHDNSSQYAIWDTQTLEIQFCKVSYDIQKEQTIYEQFNMDDYYKIRLERGI